MRMKEIRNGSLYFNFNRGRVERVRSKMNSSSVMTSEPHQDTLLGAKADDLRMATDGEVAVYREESKLVHSG
jgi:transcriptional/translational regulatory protein YebC/TACO1